MAHEDREPAERKVGLITNISAQDGLYLAECLFSKGYEIHGIILPSNTFGSNKSDYHHISNVHYHYGDVRDTMCLVKIIKAVQPTEIYNLVNESYSYEPNDMGEYTAQVGALGTLRLLDSVKICKLEERVRFCQVSSCAIFGKAPDTPQAETILFCPASPSACATLYGYWIVRNYREAYKMFACNAILFNHESPRREESFVIRKVTLSVAKIALGLVDSFDVGDLDSKRDWGHAKDYAEAMWIMLQKDEPDDFVIATGEYHSVRELVEVAFDVVGKQILWEGKGQEEVGKEKDSGVLRVKVNCKSFHPSAPELLQGDSSKALQQLGWKPKVTFKELVREMVERDIEELKVAAAKD